jgi:hypothetical protein
MNGWLVIASLSYAVLAAGHSWLGERRIIGPLLRQPWQLRSPRSFADPLLRWTWHLTSAAWLTGATVLAAAAAGAAVSTLAIDALGGLAVVSSGVILVALRGTFPGWAVFALGGLACFVGAHGWPELRLPAGLAAGLALIGLAAIHVYWSAGGRRGARAAIPTRGDGTALVQPSRIATLAVAVALVAAAAIVVSAAGSPPRAVRILALATSAAFGLRMIGDFRIVGLFKRERRTVFARWDSLVFSPLCGALCVACAMAAV